ncbi:MAG: hypothetical protein ACFFDT_14360 [Candidatus Hodarchaeota archaeon]
MENESIEKQRSQSRVTPKNLIKFFVILDLSFSIMIILNLIRYYPVGFFEYLPYYIYYISIFIWGPLLLTIAGVSYFARMTSLSRIPSNSSVYDAITLPTIQYGPIKIIFPSEEEESLKEN